MAMGGAVANLGIDSKIGPYSQSRCRNSKWTKNSGSGTDNIFRNLCAAMRSIDLSLHQPLLNYPLRS